jgi:hypothetical protein
MCVYIDKARGNDQTFCVNGSIGRHSHVPAYFEDLAIFDCNISIIPAIAGAIDDLSVCDQYVACGGATGVGLRKNREGKN